MSVLPFAGPPGAAQQPEIFGRFILTAPVGEQAHGPQTFRALDLDRELRPIVAVTRLPVWHSFDKKERIAFTAAAEAHAQCTDEAVAAYVDHGDVDGVVWRASEWVPGVSIATLLAALEQSAPVTLPASFTTSVAYILGSALLDAETRKTENILVSLQPRPRRVLLQFDGRVSLLGPTMRLTRPGDEEARFTPDDGDHPECVMLARLFFELSTGLAFGPERTLDEVGPLGRLPAELLRLTRLAVQGKTPLRDYVLQIQPLMHAAGGGHYSHIAEIVRARCAEAHAEHDRQHDKDLALARRLRLRRRPRTGKSTDTATRNLRIRPASQEGPAILEAEPNEVPQEMVLVSGGRFLFSPADDVPGYVDVKPFLLDRHPVTCGEYARFCQATGHATPTYWPQPLQVFPDPDNVTDQLRNAPVVEVTREDAEAFAAWSGKRLPSEVEWELAGRGFDGRLWPYGNEFDEKKSGSDWREPWRQREMAPVTMLEPEAASPFGVVGQGCAWEWTSTPAGELASSSWVVRGGAWRDRIEPPTLLNRSTETSAAPDVTFRCARDL